MRDEYVDVPMQIPYDYQPQGLPQMQKTDRADLIEKIKPEVAIEFVRHRLMGEELVNNCWTSVPALRLRKLTDIGAWELSNLMLGVGSINTSISKLNDKEVKNRAMSIARTAQYMCISNWVEYGIHSESQLRYVHEIVFSSAFLVLKQADDASIQELLKATVNENRNISTEKPSRSGRLKRMFGLGD